MRLVCDPDELRPVLPECADLIREQLPNVYNIDKHTMIAVVDSCGRVAALVLYGDYTPENLQMHIASRSPNWCKRGVLRGLFHYPFEQLRVGRVTAIISKSNKHARRFVERIGFRLEGVHPRMMPSGGASCSYGLIKEDCRWLTTSAL
jgi:RimJ/RimL family protein N-acetyltransferase